MKEPRSERHRPRLVARSGLIAGGPTTALLVAPLLLFAPAAPAHINGAAQCDYTIGEYPKQKQRTVSVPRWIENAQRGDIVLTAYGDQENPVRALIDALGQQYNHTLFVSQPNSGEGTRFTHETSISPGTEMVETGILGLPTGWNAGLLARMIPGNVSHDPIDWLVKGRYVSCLDDHPAATCMALDARPLNLAVGQAHLLRPTDATLAADAIAWAEAQSEGAFPYAVSSYSDFAAAWNGSGIEAIHGPGAACSGFVGGALNAVGGSIVERGYSQEHRQAAAWALYTSIFPKLFDRVNAEFPPLSVPIAQDLTNQIINCFALGGPCTADDLSWTSPGTGTAISPDDLIPSCANVSSPENEYCEWGHQAPGWATIEPADFAGGYTYEKVVGLQCCRKTGPPGFETETCRDVSTDGTGAFSTTVDLSLASFRITPDEFCVEPGDPAPPGGPLPEVQCIDLSGLSDTSTDPLLAFEPPAIRHVLVNDMAPTPATFAQASLIAGVATDGLPACVDQGVRVDVQLTTGNEDAWVSVGGVVGNPVVLVPDEAGTFDVPIVARHAAGQVHQVVESIVAADCSPHRLVAVEHYLSPAETDHVTFTVRPLPGADPVIGAFVEYDWDFGDGTFATTIEPTTTHSYALRQQGERRSSFVMSVTARDAALEEASNQHSVSLFNSHRVAVSDTSAVLPVSFERFPAAPNGVATTQVSIRNVLDESVTLGLVRLTQYPCDRTLAPAESLSTLVGGLATPMAPGDLLTGSLTVAPPGAFTASLAAPVTSICSYGVSLEATTASGRAVRAPLLLELDVHLGEDRSEPDIVTAAHALQAAMALGRPQVSPVEVEALIDQGVIHVFTAAELASPPAVPLGGVGFSIWLVASMLSAGAWRLRRRRCPERAR